MSIREDRFKLRVSRGEVCPVCRDEPVRVDGICRSCRDSFNRKKNRSIGDLIRWAIARAKRFEKRREKRR